MDHDARDDASDPSPPSEDSGFHEPSAAVKRRNLITALIIVGFVMAWILFGLRQVLV